jgi:hypothetical protein
MLVGTGITNGKEIEMGLWWEWSKYTLPSGKTVDDVNLVATKAFYGLSSLGYTDIKAAADVHGSKGGVIVGVVYPQISSQDYRQVVSCAGEEAYLNEVVGQFGILHTDYF